MDKFIVVVGTLDTKWQEIAFLHNEIESQGYKAIILDIGTKGQPGIPADINRQEIMLAAGQNPEEVASLSRGQLMDVMVKGAIQKLKEVDSRGELSGIISLGGATGTQMGTSIMKSLPFGMPKLAVSSTASLRGLAARYIGTSDITLMHSVVELFGLNDLVKSVLSRAARAVCGMVTASTEMPVSLSTRKKPLVALTQFNPCEHCATAIRRQLEEKGYQVVGFSAAGIGDRAMEEIIERDNIFGGVIDLAPGGVGEELFKSDRAAGPTRLEAAGKRGIPQVIATCGVNLMSPRKSQYKPEYYTRKKYDFDALRTAIRLSGEEMVMVADAIADKLNKAHGPVKFLIPLGGWSAVDMRGTHMYEPDLDRIFVDELKKRLRRDIEIREIDADLETNEFAQAVVEAFDDVMKSSTE